MHEATVDSIIGELSFAPDDKKLYGDSGVAYSRVSGDALISRSRSRGASHFLDNQPDSDVLVMIDHDIEWRSGDAAHIAQKARETGAIVGGLYCKRRFGNGFASRTEKFEMRLGDDKLLPAVYVATGFMAIPRSALEAVQEKIDDVIPVSDGPAHNYRTFFSCMTRPHTVIPEANEYLSEDWSFCERAKQAGVELYISSFPILNHYGDYPYRQVDATFVPEPPAAK